jgi:hypothetical protein
MCKRAKGWYLNTLHKKTTTIDYKKLKETYKQLVQFPVDKNSEAQI